MRPQTPFPVVEPDRGAPALDALAASAAREIAYLGEITPNWVPERPGTDCDVLVIGGGQSGVATAFLLRRAGIGRVRVVDAALNGREGVWLNTARMQTLRSTKTLPGPELGIASLSFRAWYETKFGMAAYDALLRCGREAWADYVSWYRQAVGVVVESDTLVESIEPSAKGFRVMLDHAGSVSTTTARKVVLATGMAGCGRPFLPENLVAAIPRSAYAHTDETIDFAPLKGKRVGVLGAASSAFDAAATALEHGAAEVRLFSRHPDLVRITTIKGMAYAGALDHYHEMSDADRWTLMSYFMRRSAGPIADTVLRATRFPNFHLHLARDWQKLRFDGAVEVETGSESFTFDFVILGTGYAMDVGARPELAGFAGEIALWRDRFDPPAGEEAPALGSYPYLGNGFEFIEKTAGAAPFLRDIHCFNYAASLSHGRAVGEIASLKHGTPRLVSMIGRDLFLADRRQHIERLKSFSTPDLTGDEYGMGPAAAVARAG